jgi:hypothetical protein
MARTVALLRLGLALALLGCSLAAAAGEPDGGPPTAAVKAGIDAYNRGDVALAFRLLKPEADRGQSDAQVNLGYLYARGQGVAVDQREAFRLYGLSAKQGNGEGMNALGYKYQFGTGIAPNLNKALNWYCLAVLQGNPRAMNNLALLLSEGRLVPRNVADARGLWRQAAAMDHVNAMLNLGLSLTNGPGTPLDPAEGKHWLMEAARHGQANAQQLIRRMGIGEPFPPPYDQAGQMQLQPRDAPPGHAEICGSVVS